MLGHGLELQHQRKRKGGIVTNGLILYLDSKDFKNSPPTSLWVDRSSSGNNVIPSNFAYTESSGLNGQGAVKLDGVDDYLSIASNSTLVMGSADFTVEAVINIDVHTVSTEFIFEKGAGSSANGWDLYISSNGQIVARIGTKYIYSGLGFIDGVDHHIALVISRNGASQFIIDGIPSGEITPDLLPVANLNATSTLYIAKRGSGNCLKGSIKVVRIYNRGLGYQEVIQNYNATK